MSDHDDVGDDRHGGDLDDHRVTDHGGLVDRCSVGPPSATDDIGDRSEPLGVASVLEPAGQPVPVAGTAPSGGFPVRGAGSPPRCHSCGVGRRCSPS